MSPTEFDLRNALRDGEGDRTLDVDGVVGDVVATVRAQRSQRRTRVLSVAAAVVLVAAAGVGGAVLVGNGDGSGSGSAAKSAGGAGGNSPYARGSNAGGADRVVPSAGGPSSALSPGCPTAYPSLMLPGGGSPGQFGSGGKMFAEAVVSLRICAYGSGPGTVAQPAKLVLTGEQAQALVTSLENAPTKRLMKACPIARGPKENRLAIYATGTSGKALPVVTATIMDPACDVMATNGTALRYDWRPPDSLTPTLLALTPQRADGAPSGFGRVSGSPVK